MSVISEDARGQVESGTPSTKEVFASALALAQAGVPTAIRFQPIFPGHEKSAGRLIEQAYDCGVRHISAEYLKLPVERHDRSTRRLSAVWNEDGRQLYAQLKARRVGREFVLPVEYKLPRLLELRETVRSFGLTFGFGDNEFIPYSDGLSCCSGSDLYLSECNLFEANSAHLIARKSKSERMYLSELLASWLPSYSVTPHLNSNDAVSNAGGRNDWIEYVTRDWQGDKRVYGPEYFHGIAFTGDFDQLGHKIYMKTEDFD